MSKLNVVSFSLDSKPTDIFYGMHHICGPEHISLVNTGVGLELKHEIGEHVYNKEAYTYDNAQAACDDYYVTVRESIQNEQANSNFMAHPRG